MTKDEIEYLVVHCSASRPSQEWTAADIDRMHRQRGFLRGGYHFVIRRDGIIENGRPEDMRGAHEPRVNGKSLGICMIGGVSEDDVKVAEDNFTERQYVALRALLLSLTGKYLGVKVIGHRDVPGVKKDCPCFDVKSKLEEWGLD